MAVLDIEEQSNGYFIAYHYEISIISEENSMLNIMSI